MGGESKNTRYAYFIFPHVGLRHFAFSSPFLCMGALGSPKGQGFLTELLDSVAEMCRTGGEEPILLPEHIRVHALRANKNPCLIVEMPEPREAREVFFVGIVLKPQGDTAADLPNALVRYFLLEKGPEGAQRPLLCEYTRDDTFINHGDGPDPVLNRFLQAIAEKCR
jgi:hypothetical protein